MKLSDNDISKVDEASAVGICIDSHLTWKNHMGHSRKRCAITVVLMTKF